ncbi:hypothetical protein BDV33DRAFT_205652 [Aspergillus novoparasiticus]|uniref:Uncharacterized protein n=1 Tax=Aspergillus novoparasiticus TaxID=986946 RepID=A0A5N6EP15_9EURO|nr:hypothetical protein BDV33DRAFT_205652 [Aspergillus novoparasiticus]
MVLELFDDNLQNTLADHPPSLLPLLAQPIQTGVDAMAVGVLAFLGKKSGER